MNNPKQPEQKVRRNRFYRIVKSTLAAAIGVQKDSAYKEDFSEKSALPFIIAGVVFTLLFISTLMLIASLVLP